MKKIILMATLLVLSANAKQIHNCQYNLKKADKYIALIEKRMNTRLIDMEAIVGYTKVAEAHMKRYEICIKNKEK